MNNKDYLTVGDLSDLCGLSTRVLRHYDKIGLLKPQKIDSKTSYRYYTKSQVFQVSMIQDLKALGFSLEEIKKVIKRENFSYLVELYKKKQKEIHSQLERLKLIESNLDFRLELFNQIAFWEKNIQGLSETYIELKVFPERKIVSIKENMKFDFESVALKVQDLQNLIRKNNLNARGPFFLIFHESYNAPDKTLIETGCFLADEENSELENIRFLAGGTYLTALQWGPHEKSLGTYQKLKDWISIHNYREINPPVKIYIKSLAFVESANELLSEIQLLVEKNS